MENVQVKIGFVPSYRFGFKDWCEKMRSESLDAFNKVEGLEIVTLDGSPDGEAPDAADGITPHGAVHTLDDAEAAAEYFLHQDVDGLILCPLDFGDERSAAKVAEKLQVPVLIYATKEPKVPDSPSLARTSDSYCGNLSMASALHRRGVPFHYAGLFFPEEEEFSEEIERFVRSVAVVKGLTGARIGHVGNRPATFETVAYDEIAMVNKFSQNVIHSDLAEIVINAEKVTLTGKKLDQEFHVRHTGYPGGQRKVSLRNVLNTHPERVVEHSVRGMLPKNRLGRQMYKKLKVYAGSEHAHQAQKPEVLEV